MFKINNSINIFFFSWFCSDPIMFIIIKLLMSYKYNAFLAIKKGTSQGVMVERFHSVLVGWSFIIPQFLCRVLVCNFFFLVCFINITIISIFFPPSSYYIPPELKEWKYITLCTYVVMECVEMMLRTVNLLFSSVIFIYFFAMCFGARLKIS